MSLPKNIYFKFAGNITELNNENVLHIHTNSVFFQSNTIMSVKDPATGETIVTLQINADLVKANSKDKLQKLKLVTNTINTYRLSLEFSEGDNKEMYSLSGRHTSTNRTLARKLFLSGLATSEYSSTIEKARADTLCVFSNLVLTGVFSPNNQRIQENMPLTYTWITKLLG